MAYDSIEKIDLLAWLQSWYDSQCDEDWEHQYGVKIDTLDNPGWRVAIDLEGTELDGVPFEKVTVERSEADWWHCWVTENKFEGAGGVFNLVSILKVFRSFAENHAE
jgi:hypothetical protein